MAHTLWVLAAMRHRMDEMLPRYLVPGGRSPSRLVEFYVYQVEFFQLSCSCKTLSICTIYGKFHMYSTKQNSCTR